MNLTHLMTFTIEVMMQKASFLQSELSKDSMCNIISRTNGYAQFCCLDCRTLAPGKLIPNPRVVLSDHLPKHLLFGGWSCPMYICYQALRGGCSWHYMGTDKNSNKNGMCLFLWTMAFIPAKILIGSFLAYKRWTHHNLGTRRLKMFQSHPWLLRVC